MTLMPVDEALAKLLDGVERLAAETVPLDKAAWRVLAMPLTALRTQPPFDASAMDGYAVRAADIASIPARLSVIGEAPAGRRFSGRVEAGQAVRIFTGAPMPDGADTVLIQENAEKIGDGLIEATESVAAGRHIRRRGLDFSKGELLLDEGRVLDPAALSLAASANHAEVAVVRKPLVAILATGDELLPPGSRLGPDQIISSNAYGVTGVVEKAGGRVLDLGIAPDRADAIEAAVERALKAGADVIVTLGGASVGDHDLVRDVLTGAGMELGFWKIAMRPGKPLMSGSFGKVQVLGLPGNPVASLVCSTLFLTPLVAKLAGRPHALDMREASLGKAMAENDLRQDYVRAVAVPSGGGLVATPFDMQDSSMLRTLADANALIVRPPFAPAAGIGDSVQAVMLR